MNRFPVRKVAVLGAGVMGAQIAAHLVNVKVPVVLFDLPAKEGPKNGIVTKAVEGLKKLKPSPLGVPEDAALIPDKFPGLVWTNEIATIGPIVRAKN